MTNSYLRMVIANRDAGLLAFIRWSKGGRMFVVVQAATGIPSFVSGIYGHDHGKLNCLDMVTMTG